MHPLLASSVAEVHPLEHLRHLADAGRLDQRVLVDETAVVLARLGRDRAMSLVACRRILERHPTAGALWWLTSRVLVAADPLAALRDAIEYLDDDPTPIPTGVVGAPVVEAVAAGPGCVVVDGTRPVAAAVVWIPRGRRLPTALLDRVAAAGDVQVLPVGSLGRILGPSGLVEASRADLAPECPLVPELLGSTVGRGQ